MEGEQARERVADDGDPSPPIPTYGEQDRADLERAEAEGMVTEAAKVSAVRPPVNKPRRRPSHVSMSYPPRGPLSRALVRAWRWLTTPERRHGS